MRNPEMIEKMFANIAPKYDRANDILSLGVHKLWRKELVNWIQNSQRIRDQVPSMSLKILDCATGTGDLALEIKRVLRNKAEVVGVDFCEAMLKTAPQKATQKNLDVTFQVGDVMELPFADNTFDIATISFGIRNVASADEGLKEMARVLKPGGELYVLEFGQPKQNTFAKIYNFYSQKILPKIGGVVTGNQKAYKYLEDSSAHFPCREDFLEMMESTGLLQNFNYRTLTMGIAYIYKAQKKQVHIT